jgi:hypothetical protein
MLRHVVWYLVYLCFGGKYCLYLQREQTVSQTSKQRTECGMACLLLYLLGLLFDPKDEGSTFF